MLKLSSRFFLMKATKIKLFQVSTVYPQESSNVKQVIPSAIICSCLTNGTSMWHFEEKAEARQMIPRRLNKTMT